MAVDVTNGAEPSASALVGGILTDAENLLKQQLELFRVELQQDVNKARGAAPAVLAGGGLALIGSILLGFTLAYLLQALVPNMPLWGCFGVVGLLLFAVGAALVSVTMSRFRTLNPLPEQALEGLKENVEWQANPK
jgi:uncharacterized membrane protein YqjE